VTLLAPNESLVCVRRFDVAGSVIKENLLKRAVHGDESLWRHGDEIVSMRSRDVAERVHAKRTYLEPYRLEGGSEGARNLTLWLPARHGGHDRPVRVKAEWAINRNARGI
jgi:hypothetical protein